MSYAVNFKKFILLLGDVILLYLSLAATVLLSFPGRFNFDIFSLHILPFSILYSFWIIIFYIFGLYDLHLIKTKISFLNRALGAIFVSLVLGGLFFYTLPMFGISPKSNLLLDVLIFGVLFLIWRNFFYSLFSSFFVNRVAILGQGPQVELLKEEISKRPYLGYKLVSIDSTGDFFLQVQKKNINTLIFTEDYESDPRLLKSLYLSTPAKVTFLDFTQAYEMITEKIPISMISQSWFLENLREGESALYDKGKRFIDIALSSVILILTLPFWPLIALLIKLEDHGPVFYYQKRTGKDRKPFTLYKFRSMEVGAEKGEAVWAEKEDKRITKIGGFLRKTHLDEIPQMINIIKGDISLVGPRPERPEFIEKLKDEIPYYHLRHIIKPGFTGWAQIKFRYGRSLMDSHEKFEYDLYYLKNRNLFVDFGVLLKTFQLFFKKE